MPSITCPRCDSPVPLRRFLNVGNKPFCSRCGWNLDRAETALASKSTFVKFIPLGLVAMILFFIFVNARANTPVMFIIPAIFLLIALVPIAGYYSTQKAIAAAKFTINPDLALAQPPLDPALQILQSLPRPRRVRFRFTGSLAPMVVFGAIAVLNIILFMAVGRVPRHNNNDPSATVIPFFFVFIVFLVIMLVPFFRDKRNLPLLRDGQLALARVVSQRAVQQGKTSCSSIDYQFKTSSGLEIRSSARDLTNRVFEDMTIPVFYDPVSPDKNITPCATYLTVVNSLS
jgi:uncharacterized protein (DUF983 family)